MVAMYRILLPVLLCSATVLTAPQDAVNSDITYVKIQPVIDDISADDIPETQQNHRESRIENLPLTIPGNLSQESKKETESNQSEIESESRTNSPKSKKADYRSKEESGENDSGEKSRKYERKYTFRKTSKTNKDSKLNPAETKVGESKKSNVSNQSETKVAESKVSHDNNQLEAKVPDSKASNEINQSESETNKSELKPVTHVEVSESSEKLHEESEEILTEKSEIDPTAVDLVSDIIASDTNQYEKQILEISTTNYDTSEPDASEITTVKLEVQNTTEYMKQTKPTFTKLGYFGKSYSTSLNNLIDRPVKRRRFRSRCRCEKIWNCPKLQISVHRCPEDYFLCCF